jgi:VanZ family protein
MKNFFSNYKIIFYLINTILIIFYLFPGSLLGWIIYGNLKTQPQITQDFLISSNHFYVFFIISVTGFLTFTKLNQIKKLIYYLLTLSIILEILHIAIPQRSFEWLDLFGNLIGVVVVIFLKNLINKYGIIKK